MKEKEIISKKGNEYCVFCKKYSKAGKPFFVLVENETIGRHVKCKPRKYKREPQLSIREDFVFGGAKRRRAGGHAYSGGDGWIEI
jgi:hypothetical protein